MLPFDLPNWNEGIQATAAFDGKNLQEPTDNPLIAHRPKSLQITSLEDEQADNNALFWLYKAALLEASHQDAAAEQLLMEALQCDIQPATSIAQALHDLHIKRETLSNTHVLSVYLAPPQTTSDAHPRTSLTPSRIGLSGRALRVPTELAETPGSVQDAAMPPITKFHGILKKLEFSTLKTHLLSSTTVDASAAAKTVASVLPQTTTKRLQFFDGKETPNLCPSTLGTLMNNAKASRRVTFGAHTVSPSHEKPRRLSQASTIDPASTTMAHALAADVATTAVHTPQSVASEHATTVDQNASDNDGIPSEDGVVVGGSVNSKDAGSTPFDRRLSSLFAKYGGDITGSDSDEGDAAEEEEDDDDDDEEAADEDGDEFAFSTHVGNVSDCLRALTVPAAAIQHRVIPTAASDDKSIQSIPDQPLASVLGQLLRHSLDDIKTSRQEKEDSVPRPSMTGVISPSAGVLGLTPRRLAQHGIFAATNDAADANDDTTTNGMSDSIHDWSSDASSFTPMSFDGIKRDSMGIPLTTPGTVTVFRGSGGDGSRAALYRDASLPVDLSRSFNTTPGSNSTASISNIEPAKQCLAEQLQGCNDQNSGKISSGSDKDDFAFHKPTQDNNLPSPSIVPTPRSASGSPSKIRSFHEATRAGTPSTFYLGKAQRIASPSPGALSPATEACRIIGGLSLTMPPTTGIEHATHGTVNNRKSGGDVDLESVGVGDGMTPHQDQNIVDPYLRRSPRLASMHTPMTSPGSRTKQSTGRSADGGAMRRSSTAKKSRRKIKGEEATSERPGSGNGVGKKGSPSSPSDNSLKLSPTEQNIRDSLRRSSRLSRKTLSASNT